MDTLDIMPIGIVLLGSSGAVLTANRIAREIIETEEALGGNGFGMKLSAGRFRFRDFLTKLDRRSTQGGRRDPVLLGTAAWRAPADHSVGDAGQGMHAAEPTVTRRPCCSSATPNVRSMSTRAISSASTASAARKRVSLSCSRKACA